MATADPIQTLVRLKRIISENKRPSIMIHQFLTSGTAEANIVANKIIEHKETVKLLTSPEGRKWLYYWFNDTLDYLQQIAESR